MLIALMVAHFTHHLVNSLLIPLTPFIRDGLTLDYTQAGFVISAFGLTYGVSQLPAGWLADRFGPRILITIAISGVAFAGLLVGLSQTYIMLIAFLILMGILGGGYHPAAAPLVTASVAPENQGRALGLHMATGSCPFWIAPLFVGAVAPILGWRGTFIGLAIPTIVFGIVLYIMLGRSAGAKKAGHTAINTDSEAEHSEVPIGERKQVAGYLRDLVPFITLAAFGSAAIFSVKAFIPLFLVDQFGVGNEAAATSLVLVYTAGIWVSPLAGYLSDRIGALSVVLVGSLAAGPIIYLLNLAPNWFGIGAVLVVLGIASYIRIPPTEAYVINRTSERNRSTILGIFYFVNMEGGGALTPVVGYLIDRFGFYLSFTAMGAAMVVMTLVCSIWLWAGRDRLTSE